MPATTAAGMPTRLMFCEGIEVRIIGINHLDRVGGPGIEFTPAAP